MTRAAAKTSLHREVPAGRLAGQTAPQLRLHEPTPDPEVVAKIEDVLVRWLLDELEAQEMEARKP